MKNGSFEGFSTQNNACFFLKIVSPHLHHRKSAPSVRIFYGLNMEGVERVGLE